LKRFFGEFYGKKIIIKKLHDSSSTDDYVADKEESLSIVELLRIEAGKFLYEYPTTFRRTVKVIRKQPG